MGVQLGLKNSPLNVCDRGNKRLGSRKMLFRTYSSELIGKPAFLIYFCLDTSLIFSGSLGVEGVSSPEASHPVPNVKSLSLIQIGIMEIRTLLESRPGS